MKKKIKPPTNNLVCNICCNLSSSLHMPECVNKEIFGTWKCLEFFVSCSFCLLMISRVKQWLSSGTELELIFFELILEFVLILELIHKGLFKAPQSVFEDVKIISPSRRIYLPVPAAQEIPTLPQLSFFSFYFPYCFPVNHKTHT